MAIHIIKEEDIPPEKIDYIDTIVHDVSNILQVIMGRLEIAAIKHRYHPVKNDLEQLQSYFLILSQYLQQLRQIAKKKQMEPEIFDVTEAIADTVQVMEKLDTVKAKIIVEKPDHPIYIEMNTFQFRQVLTNLCLNAIEATDRKYHRKIKITVSKEEEYVAISVKDNGCGMDEETKEKIFNPFFTTKKHGIGLGLSIVYSIIRQSGGYIEVDTALEKGTTFHIYLPVNHPITKVRGLFREE